MKNQKAEAVWVFSQRRDFEIQVQRTHGAPGPQHHNDSSWILSGQTILGQTSTQTSWDPPHPNCQLTDMLSSLSSLFSDQDFLSSPTGYICGQSNSKGLLFLLFWGALLVRLALPQETQILTPPCCAPFFLQVWLFNPQTLIGWTDINTTFYRWLSIQPGAVTCTQYNPGCTYFTDKKINVLRKNIQVIHDRTETLDMLTFPLYIDFIYQTLWYCIAF